MALFELIVDEQVKAWTRTTVKVEAESLVEAIEMCTQYGTDHENVVTIVDSDFLLGTEEKLCPEDDPTIEVMDFNYNILGTNATFSR